MTARESVARAWHTGSDHAAESPFGGPTCNCWRVADRIVPLLRQEWDEGYRAGSEDMSDLRAGRLTMQTITSNPYLNGEDQ